MKNSQDYQTLENAYETMKFLANEKRLALLCRIGEEEASAGELAEFLEMAPSALSQHLRRLKEAGIVETRREHRVIYYRLADNNTRKIISLLKEIYCSS
jgi:ArsR family transcriptional regulator